MSDARSGAVAEQARTACEATAELKQAKCAARADSEREQCGAYAAQVQCPSGFARCSSRQQSAEKPSQVQASASRVERRQWARSSRQN